MRRCVVAPPTASVSMVAACSVVRVSSYGDSCGHSHRWILLAALLGKEKRERERTNKILKLRDHIESDKPTEAEACTSERGYSSERPPTRKETVSGSFETAPFKMTERLR